jgi:adenine-specific DNA-methyltransferase
MGKKYQKYEKYSKEELAEEIIRLKKRKKYGLVWEDKPEDVVEQCKKDLPVLEEVKKKEIITDPDKPTNLLIEGDNYHALSVLNYTHKGKIDVIYIDPPYNTGAKDWKYNNQYVDDNDCYRHSKWLSMMNNRLRHAKKLLSKKGVLICTIDKYEQATLHLLLDELFVGYEIVCVTIVHNPAGTQGKNFSYTNEYAFFVFPKNGAYINKTTREDALVSAFRDWGTISLRSQAKTCFYPIIVKGMKIVRFGDVCDNDFHPDSSNVKQRDGTIFIYPIDKDGVEKKWVFSRGSVEKIQGELFCKKKGKEIIVFRRKNEASYKTVWDDKKFYANIYGSKLLNKIIDNNFPFPKSLYAVMESIKAIVHNKDNAIILDYFAGSGTTGHAVLELNKEDGGNRKFILCTNNENTKEEEKTFCKKHNITEKKLLIWKKQKKKEWIEWAEKHGICSSVTLPRIRKVINGYKGENGKITGMGGNLKYFKTAFVPAGTTDKNKTILTKKATEMLCVKEGTFEKVKSNKQYKIFCNKKRYTGIIFDHLAIADFKNAISEINGKFRVYVFSLGDDTFDEEFVDMSRKVKLSPIPEAILRVYCRIFK